jgi:chaperonin cofactor prefoldin
MSQLVKLEKRFEDAIKRLEFALSDKIVNKEVSGSFNEKEEVSKQGRDNIEKLLNRIAYLEKAAENDAKEIDKLISKLQEILEAKND